MPLCLPGSSLRLPTQEQQEKKDDWAGHAHSKNRDVVAAEVGSYEGAVV